MRRRIVQGARIYSLAYDDRSNLASLTDPLGRTTSFSYDPAGRPLTQTLPDGRIVSLGYDASGNVTSVTPPGRPAHSFAYTPVDLEQSYSPPSLGFPSSTQTSYNLDQQVSLISRPSGDSIVPSYDSAGRLSALATSAGTTSYAYSPTTGQLVQIAAPDGGKLSYAYDGALLTDTSWSGLISGTMHRSYDNFFRVASESVSGGQPVSYQYDPDGLLTAAGALAIQRDPSSGFVAGTALGNVTDAHGYNSYGEESSYSASFSGSSLYSVSYTRDALGRIASKTERVGTEPAHTFSYGYDLAGRLTDVAKDGSPTAHYAYDANGNRIAGPGLTASPGYDAQDRLTSYGACTYSYKADGSLQTKTCPNGTTTYDYDAFGNLRNVALLNGTHIEYVIDGQNRRVGKKVCATAINVSCPASSLVEGFLYRDQLQPAAWLDGTGVPKATFVYGLRPNAPEYMVKGGITYRLVKDQVGSVRLVLDPNDNVAERIDYDEFGNVLADTSPGFQPFGFAGGLREVDTSLTRLGARDFDPVTNDPINHIDPSGDNWQDWDLQPYADFFAGFGDTITGVPFTDWSLTGLARDLTGAGDVVNKCSGAYTGGKWTGRAWWIAVTGLGSGSRGWLLGRGGRGILNRNDFLRVGWSWKGTAQNGKEILRIAIGSKGLPFHWHWP